MITVAGLAHRYRRGGDVLFGGLSHVFDAGSVTAVTGASGSGKSTLLYLIGLLLTPSVGVIRFGDRDVSTVSDRVRSQIRAQQIGFVFQDASLDASRPVIDNVLEGALYAGLRRGDAKMRAHRLLADLGVVLRDDHRPGEVSGGQAQRVGLCRALIKDPKVIVADEPTGNLDTDSAAVVIAALRDTADAGATVIIASHDPDVADAAEHVLAL
ncbi:MAG: ATP-binding cassette domain-containing protein [Acidimicrobiia bacterium]|nr:ATP-binding cassette domain-containing protein [Acidimicrobiia bacterium]